MRRFKFCYWIAFFSVSKIFAAENECIFYMQCLREHTQNLQNISDIRNYLRSSNVFQNISLKEIGLFQECLQKEQDTPNGTLENVFLDLLKKRAEQSTYFNKYCIK